MTNAFGDIMRDWRKQRRFSQLELAMQADVSARHLSFIETGRSTPSRQMVLKLADCLEMPKPETNRALLSAGLAPAYKSRAENDTDLAPLHQAVAHLLNNHMPYPAIAADRLWNITGANEAAIRLLTDCGFGGHTNLLEALIAQSPEQSSIVNWAESVGLILSRLRVERSLFGEEDKLADLMHKLEAHLNRHGATSPADRAQAIIPTKFNIGGTVISLFSTIAQFGTVQDIALGELKVELMFPMNDATERYFQQTD